MKKDQLTKHQHFIPNFLIKRWKINDDIIIVNDLGIKNIVPFSENKNYFSKEFLYESNENEVKNFLENKLNKIEEKYANLTKKIINNIENEIFLKDMGLHINDIALIELFTKLQMFRNRDYWELLNENKNIIINYLNELIDSYYKYTKMSKREKQILENELISKREELEKKLDKIGFDKFEYEIHKLYNSPKYFIIHSIHLTYYFTVISFKNRYLPISNLGQFIFSEEIGENYFYLIPISPKVAILKRVFNLNEEQNFKLLFESFHVKNECKVNCKKIMFNELRSVSKYSIASPEFLNEDFLKEFNLYMNQKIVMRIMDNQIKKNKSIVDKTNSVKKVK